MKAKRVQLNKVQSHFKTLMLDHPDALDAPDEAFAAQFETGRIPLPRRLKVYRNNIIGSLTDVMVASFPLIETLVGKEFLEGCARTFILQNPPQQGCLNTYGAGFDDFLSMFKPAAALPYLPDVAAFEIAMNAAYYAPDAQPLTAEALAMIAPEMLADIHLNPAGHVHFIESAYPILAIKAFCENGGEGTLNLDQGGVKLMVSRPALEVQIVELAEDEYLTLSLLHNEKPLGEAVEAVVKAYPNFDFQAFLQKHLDLQTFASIPPSAD